MQRKCGFVYIWFDRKHKRYYIGCHWGYQDDGYICSSPWMKKAYLNRPYDFKRRILKSSIEHRPDMYLEEQKWLNMIKPEEIKPINHKPRYYNLNRSVGNLWHKYDDSIKTVGQKISAAKKGKPMGPCSPEKAKSISEAKKKAFALRGGMTPEHKEAISKSKLGSKHTEEWKQNNSIRLKEQWSDGTRIKTKAEPKVKMTKEEQGKLHSQRLKERWADPIWAANQRAKLKAAKHSI